MHKNPTCIENYSMSGFVGPTRHLAQQWKQGEFTAKNVLSTSVQTTDIGNMKARDFPWRKSRIRPFSMACYVHAASQYIHTGCRSLFFWRLLNKNESKLDWRKWRGVMSGKPQNPSSDWLFTLSLCSRGKGETHWLDCSRQSQKILNYDIKIIWSVQNTEQYSPWKDKYQQSPKNQLILLH